MALQQGWGSHGEVEYNGVEAETGVQGGAWLRSGGGSPTVRWSPREVDRSGVEAESTVSLEERWGEAVAHARRAALHGVSRLLRRARTCWPEHPATEDVTEDVREDEDMTENAGEGQDAGRGRRRTLEEEKRG